MTKDLYKKLVPVISARSDSKFIINSAPNGYNFFYDLVLGATEGNHDRNCFHLTTTYWWQVEGRGEEWVREQVKMIGNRDFDRLYNLSFNVK